MPTVAVVPQQRSIGGVVAQVTIRESYRNDMTITEHPLEIGANIADHAYVRPREIEIEIGWDGSQGNPGDFFNLLKQLQQARQPFTIFTDRDILPNMLVAGIATVTDQRTAYSFMALVRCRQVNLVSTQSTTTEGAFAGFPTVGSGDFAFPGQFTIPGTTTVVPGFNIGSGTFSAFPDITTPSTDQGTQGLQPGGALNLADPSLGAIGVIGSTGSE